LGGPQDRAASLVPLSGIVKPAIDVGDLFHPLLALVVLQLHDRVERPVEVIGQIGYLLLQAAEGVAYNPPSSARSTSCLVWHAGQVTVMVVLPSSLIRRYSACK
jgi:hypothetical protein